MNQEQQNLTEQQANAGSAATAEQESAAQPPAKGAAVKEPKKLDPMKVREGDQVELCILRNGRAAYDFVDAEVVRVHRPDRKGARPTLDLVFRSGRNRIEIKDVAYSEVPMPMNWRT